MTDEVNLTVAGDGTEVVLVPGADFLFFLHDPDLPETDVLRELRLYYSAQYRAISLGPSEYVESLRTIAEFAEAGVIGNAAFLFSTATVAYLTRLARRPASIQIDAEAAIRIALDIFALALRESRASKKTKVVEAVPSKGGWRISLVREGLSAEVHISSRGVVSMKVDPSTVGGPPK